MFKEVIIPLSVTYIGEHAFSNCKSLNHVTIPPSVTEIVSYAFDECDELTDFQVDFTKTTNFGLLAYNKCLDFKIEYEFNNVFFFSSVRKHYKQLESL